MWKADICDLGVATLTPDFFEGGIDRNTSDSWFVLINSYRLKFACIFQDQSRWYRVFYWTPRREDVGDTRLPVSGATFSFLPSWSRYQIWIIGCDILFLSSPWPIYIFSFFFFLFFSPSELPQINNYNFMIRISSNELGPESPIENYFGVIHTPGRTNQGST